MMNFLLPVKTFAASCSGGSLFGFPKWYEYLDGKTVKVDGVTVCSPVIDSLTDFWLIGLAIAEILLRVIVLVTIIYVMFGGFKYVSARGNAEKLERARTTITDALTGLAIAIVASAFVAFIAGRFTE